ncbi:dynamin family protein [Microbispora sp. H13382]|uniref:dynamin family protein n=1 Tax=Microbispora sp. H13382 TaxID=2729112 RepID=UPI0016033BF1|nr:dynamin family protein [Microbispora sp. H13382]
MPTRSDARPTGRGEFTKRAEPLLGELARHCGTELRDRVSTVVAHADASLAEKTVWVVFGGHFSCGKSSLINTLIGRPLLPTGDFPETGVPCWIRPGAAESAIAYIADRKVPLDFSTESIAREVSLIGATGDYREEVRRVDRLLVTVGSGAIPPWATWIDSPGINDTEEMTERARRTAAQADLLVWVVNSRQPMSLTEQSFLQSHVERHGAAGVLFVVNVFLTRDTREAWTRFLTDRAGYFRDRIASSFGETSPEVVFVSARAAAGDPGDFGLPEVRRLMKELAGPRDARVRAARLERTSHRLAETARMLDELARRENEQIDRATMELARFRKERTGRVERFRKEVRRAVGAAFRNAGTAAQACGPAVAAEMARGPLRRDNSYGLSLARRFRAVADDLDRGLKDAIDRCAEDCGHNRLPKQARSSLKRMLQPADLIVPVPMNALGHGRFAAAVDRAIDKAPPTQLSLLRGLRDRAVDFGREFSGRTETKDLAEAQASALSAGAAAAAELAGRQSAVVRLALRDCLPVGDEPHVPDQQAVIAIEALRDHLRNVADDCLERAGGAHKT